MICGRLWLTGQGSNDHNPPNSLQIGMLVLAILAIVPAHLLNPMSQDALLQLIGFFAVPTLLDSVRAWATPIAKFLLQISSTALKYLLSTTLAIFTVVFKINNVIINCHQTAIDLLRTTNPPFQEHHTKKDQQAQEDQTKKDQTILIGKETMRELLECPVCCEIPKSHIYQCSKGHLICSSCHRKMPSTDKKCPICREAYKKNISRNLFAEQIRDAAGDFEG